MLTVPPAEVLQRVRDVESSLSSERVAVVGGDHVKGSVRDGVGMDAKWEHQPVRENTSGCKSVRSRTFSVQVSGILTSR